MTRMLQSLKKLLSGIAEAPESVMVSGLATDSRRVAAGDVFIALKGQTVDARQWIPSAIERGAVAVLCDERQADGCQRNVGVPVIAIPQLQQQQGDIAAAFYGHPSKAMRVVGITGTNGKTTCSQWIAQALHDYHLSCGVIGTLGMGFPGHLQPSGHTTPDAVMLQSTLADLRDQGAQAVAMEVSSHALAQSRLCGMHFDVAVLTQLSRDHLDYHGTMAAYAATKRRLFDWSSLNAAVINIDDAYGARWARVLASRYPVITYAMDNPDALVYAKSVVHMADGYHVEVVSPWGEGVFKLPFIGRFNVSNALAVLSVLNHFEMPMHHSLSVLAGLAPVQGRMQRWGSATTPTIIVDYAHTPDALAQVLETLRSHAVGAVWCVFGCGGDRDTGKRAEMAAVVEQHSDHAVVTSDNPRTESPEAIIAEIVQGFKKMRPMVCADRAEAITLALSNAAVNDIVLIAGKGHECYQIIQHEHQPFSDVVQVQQWLRTQGVCL